MPITLTTDSGSFQVSSQDSSLLDTLERTGHQIEYQCRQGYCGACRTPLISGTVTYTTDPLATVAPGSILPCCCKADSDIKLTVTAMI
ncbi:class I ribonucleotide reductase maintenance protein YfaE [Moritella sp.]|uniref:class I ribonucleotide reductase maintenance protein YfaE n=1 Tax=Moritella sp. TaxID=78556 RepID=UPI001DCC710E|nr:class I ribonucleotide reductase maintenance protein YfaE [Moritella sp.]MCJ8352173.1 class I ribonucleotide reductase maintenance protein YfaE [Moritella sp.]NQZ42428.1 2Fe-2S ferredoxin-like protein [Moritella sp.]